MLLFNQTPLASLVQGAQRQLQPSQALPTRFGSPCQLSAFHCQPAGVRSGVIRRANQEPNAADSAAQLLTDTAQLDDDEVCAVDQDGLQIMDLFPGGAKGTEDFMRGLVRTGLTGTIAILLASSAGVDPLEHWDMSPQLLQLVLGLCLPALLASAAIALPRFGPRPSSAQLQQLQDAHDEVTSRFGGLGYKPDFEAHSKLDAVMGSIRHLDRHSSRQALHLLQQFTLECWLQQGDRAAGPSNQAAAAPSEAAAAAAAAAAAPAAAAEEEVLTQERSRPDKSALAAAGRRCTGSQAVLEPEQVKRLEGVRAGLGLLQAGSQCLDILARELLLRGCCFLWLSHLASEQLLQPCQAGSVLLLPALLGAAPQQVALWTGWAGMMVLAVPAAQAAAQPGQMFVRLHVMRQGAGPQLPLTYKLRNMLSCTEWEVAGGRLDLGYDPVTDAQLDVRTPHDALAARVGVAQALLRALALNTAFAATGGNLAAPCVASWCLDRASEALAGAGRRRQG